MKIREIMTSDVESAQPDATLQEIAKKMRDEDVGAIPIVEDDELLGIVTDRDIVLRCIAEGKDASETEVQEILSEDVESISPDDDVQRAADIMGRRQIRRLPVLEDGELVGMVSLGDIAVKQQRDEISGEALEEVSEGVKPSRGEKKAAGRSASPELMSGRKGGRTESGEGARGRSPQKATGGAAQGISSRNRGEEERRQSKVNAGRAGSKRRAS